MHQPGHQVGAIAAEVIQSPSAILRRVRKPAKKLRGDANLLWSLMPVVDHHPPDCAKPALFHFVKRGAIARVPGGFVVHQHMDVVLPRHLADGQRVVKRDGQRLFHHHRNAVFRGGLNDLAVVADRRIHQHRLWMARLDHLVHIQKEQPRVESILLLVFCRQGWFRVGNPYQFHFRMPRQRR